MFHVNIFGKESPFDSELAKFASRNRATEFSDRVRTVLSES